MNFIPYKLIQNFIFLYVWSTYIIERVYKQTKKSSLQLINSFSDETLYFFHDSTIPLITGNITSTIINPDLESKCWSFHNNTFKYMDGITCSSKKLPYLSASLFKDGTFIADLSDWLQSIDVISSNTIPTRFLVFAWAYKNNIVLESYSSSKYELRVITMDGDDLSLDIKIS